MTQIKMPPPFVPLLCTRPASPTAGGATVTLVFDGVAWEIDLDLLDRADGYTVDTLSNAAMFGLGLYESDQPILSAGGMDDPWAKKLRGHVFALADLYQEVVESEHAAEAARLVAGTPAPTDEARELLREVILTPQLNRTSLFSFGVSDLQSFSGVRDALWEIAGKLRHAEFRKLLTDRGIAPQRLDRLAQIGKDLFKDRLKATSEKGQAVEVPTPLRAAKAMTLGDLLLLSATARARLSPARWEHYQIGRLLGTARRREDAPVVPPTPPVAGPLPAPTPPVAGPAPVVAQPAPAGPLPSPTPTPATPPVLHPALGGALPSPVPSPTAFAPVLSSAPAPGPIALVPGTVLCTLPASGGPALSAVVREGGDIAWVPVMTPTPAAPAAFTPPPVVASQPAPPAPRKRTSRR